MGAHTDLLHHGHIGPPWRQFLAGTGIVILAGLGLYYAISSWHHGEISAGLMALGFFVGTALIYAFGYFRCLPDVLGGVAFDVGRNLRQRWSDFALLSTFIGLLIINAAYIRAIWQNFSYVELTRAVAFLVICSWILPASVVASEMYLGWTMPGVEIPRGRDWRARVRQGVRTWGNWMVKLVGSRRALAIGGVLALLSLILAVDAEIFGPNYTGYQIITGREAWPTVTGLDTPRLAVLLAGGYRTVYELGLLVAVFALGGAVLGRWGDTLRRNRILAVLAGTIALLEITNVAVCLGLQVCEVGKWALALWVPTWVIPVAIWLVRAPGNRGTWDHTRLAVMVFYLPIFLLGFAFLVVFAYFGAGFGAFIVGMLLVWWGLVQSGQEVTQKTGLE